MKPAEILAMLNSGAGKFERAADLVAKFYAHKLVQSHNEFTIKCTECDFKIDPRILLFGGEQAIIKALDSFGKCGAAKMQAVFDDHKKAICCGIEECDCFKYLNRFC